MTSGARPVRNPTGRLLVLLGADPDVFRAIARAHGLMARRRAGLVRNRGGFARSSPFRALCLFAVVYGLFGMVFILGAKRPLLGDAVAVAMGCVFLLMVVVTDHLDVLVNPREQLVLGAHPHDDRSILLAKLWIVGRTLAFLFALMLAPTLLVVAVRQGIPNGVLFAAGFAAAAASACVAGLYAGGAVLTFFGRAAYERVMPWVQMAFQVSYFVFIGGQRLIGKMTLGTIPPSVAWGFPPLWFLAPLQALEEGGFSASSAARAVLAAAVLLGLCVGGTRWLGSRVGERLLEPIERSARPPSARPRSRPTARFRLLDRLMGSERRHLFDLLRVHLRSDWRTRSEFFMAPVVCAFVFATSSRQWNAWAALGFIGWMTLASMDILTRSSRPEVLWFVLVSPVDRVRFSLATVSLTRVFQLLPLVAVFIALKWTSVGGATLDRLLFLLLLVLYADLLLLAGRALFPEFPFSRGSRAGSQMSGPRMVLFLVGGLASGLGTLSLYLLGRLGRPGLLLAIGLLVLGHLPAEWGMRRRVSAAAADIELEPASVA